MNSSPLEPPRWSRARWWSLLALVFTFQLGLIFWLGARGPVYAGRTAPVLTLRIAGPAFNDLLALTDPTLFALPHLQGFAGPAWLTVPRIGGNPFIWSEPPRWLPLPVEQLGAVFRDYIRTNQFIPREAPSRPKPEFLFPEVANSPNLPQKSAIRLAGSLAELNPATAFTLQSWTNSEMLTNSVVQVLVGPDGRPVSVTLLSSSGLKEADQSALQQAVQARFEPTQIRSEGAKARARRLAWVQMIFEWHTVPPPPPPATPN